MQSFQNLKIGSARLEIQVRAGYDCYIAVLGSKLLAKLKFELPISFCLHLQMVFDKL